MQAGATGAEPDIVALARTALQEGQAALAVRDNANALRWLGRAHRLVPLDTNVTLTLASACLQDDPSRAAMLFLSVAQHHDIKQAWVGLAAARLLCDGPAAATSAMRAVLSRHAFTPDVATLADHIAGPAGWCGLRSDGTLEVHARGHIQITQDGRTLIGRTLAPGWATSRSVDVRCGETPLLGSPIQPNALRRAAGCVEVADGGIKGWAWHPADPDTHPELTLRWPATGQVRTLVADDESVVTPDTGPLARPRTFRLTREQLQDGSGLLHIDGPDGRPLLGSPLDPYAEQIDLIEATLALGQKYPTDAAPPKVQHASATSLPVDEPTPGRPVGADGRKRAVTIVIPVHNGGAVALNCIASVRASLPPDVKLLVVDDASDDPGLLSVLAELAAARQIRRLRHDRPKGFPASANAGIRAARGRDVVLLNSDTLVPAGWLDRLRDAAYSAPDIGTVTPLSNEATILSYPGETGANPRPDQASTDRLDRLASRANKAMTVDIPVGVGFCLYLRRDCLNTVGLLRDDVFAQGYGEENDFCLRARRLGWRNVALTGLFVGHVGGASFGAGATHLRRRNAKILERLHPGHDALVQAFTARDPLADARRRIDLLRWRDASRGPCPSVILISHNDGGGVEHRLALSVQAHARAGRRPIVLRPAPTEFGDTAISVHDGVGTDFPNLVYALPNELPLLLKLLRATRPEAIEVHHVLGHGPAIYDLVDQLGLPYDVHVHDYVWFCPRISLVSGYEYCGEPDVHACEACVADNGHFLREAIGVADLRRRSMDFLAAARSVIVPSDDAAFRMGRHFPGVPLRVAEHEDDRLIPLSWRNRPANQRPRVCVVGAIGLHKGYDVLLACARDAERRRLDLEFVVVGHTIDDARMMATGRVFVTGEYRPDEAVELIGRQRADLGFIASIWPETWCLTLGDIWRAGLPAAAFDIGVPADRIRRTGRGFILPLGLSAGAINDALLAAIKLGREWMINPDEGCTGRGNDWLDKYKQHSNTLQSPVSAIL